MNDKIQEYLSAGVDRVWFVNPRRRSVLVYRPSGQVEALKVGDVLRDEEILPGFSLPLSDLFRD
jgi:Uma2 family endonuclease